MEAYWDAIVDVALNGLSIYTSHALHQSRVELDKCLHTKELNFEDKLYKETERNENETHLLEILSELERHFQQLNADLISTSREAERDMFDQRSQQFQTMGLAATIMLTSLITVLVQGVLPTTSGNALYLSYAVTNAASLALLTICIVLCVEIVTKAAHFMFKRSAKYKRELSEAMLSTRAMMRNVRSGKYIPEAEPRQRRLGKRGRSGSSSARSRSSTGSAKTPTLTPRAVFLGHRNIAKMDDTTFRKEWITHENEVNNFMKTREDIHHKLATVLLGDPSNINQAPKDFSSFWEKFCKFRANVAIFCFYAGTLLMITATVIYMWANFLINYETAIASKIAVAIFGLAGTLAIALAIYLRVADESWRGRRSRELVEQAAASDGNHDDGSSSSSAEEASAAVDALSELKSSEQMGELSSKLSLINPNSLKPSFFKDPRNSESEFLSRSHGSSSSIQQMLQKSEGGSEDYNVPIRQPRRSSTPVPVRSPSVKCYSPRQLKSLSTPSTISSASITLQTDITETTRMQFPHRL